MERYSLHQYSLRTNNWHISTKYSVIWRSDRCVMVCYYWLCKHSIHVSFSADRQKERAKPLYTMLLGCMHTLLSVAFRTTHKHTQHTSHLGPIGSDVLTFACVFAIRSIGLSIRLYCRSHNSACAHLEHLWMLNRLIVANFAPIRHNKTSESDITSFFR